jgi:hypothetical protein
MIGTRRSILKPHRQGSYRGFGFGLLFSDNIALGLTFGVMIGVVVGAVADVQAARQ